MIQTKHFGAFKINAIHHITELYRNGTDMEFRIISYGIMTKHICMLSIPNHTDGHDAVEYKHDKDIQTIKECQEDYDLIVSKLNIKNIPADYSQSILFGMWLRTTDFNINGRSMEECYEEFINQTK